MLLPTVELHVHLRGTIRPNMLKRLADRNGIIIPDLSYKEDTYRWQDFDEFLKIYHIVADVIRTPLDYAEITEDYLVRAAKDGCIYCELSVAPDHAYSLGLSYENVIEAIEEGIYQAHSKTGIYAKIIVTCVRHLGAERAINLANKIYFAPTSIVAGFGMSGKESSYPSRDFKKAYDIARNAGLLLTAHSGEFCNSNAIWETINVLKVNRLGHAISAATDNGLIQFIARKKIGMEICPTSNVKLGLFSEYDSHPFPIFFNAGCKVTLNSDDPAHFQGSLRNEYDIAKNKFKLSNIELNIITKNAIETAFCEESLKKELMLRLDY